MLDILLAFIGNKTIVQTIEYFAFVVIKTFPVLFLLFTQHSLFRYRRLRGH